MRGPIGLVVLAVLLASAGLTASSAGAQSNGFALELSVVGQPDNIVPANNQAITVAASLVYDGADQGPHDVTDLTLRVSGALEWDANGRSSLRVPDQTVSCAATGEQVGCPLNLVSDEDGWQINSQITIARGWEVGHAFTVSASARVGGQTVSGSLQLTVGGDTSPEPPPPPPPESDFSINLSLVGEPDNVVPANNQAITVAASLVYDGTDQGPHDVTDLTLRVSGALEWDSNGRSSLRIADQAVSCTAAGGQVRCPLSLVSDGFDPQITISRGWEVGHAFTVSVSARVGGQTASGSLQLTVGGSSPPEPPPPPPESDFSINLSLVGEPDNVVPANNQAITVAASLVYDGTDRGGGGTTFRTSCCASAAHWSGTPTGVARSASRINPCPALRRVDRCAVR